MTPDPGQQTNGAKPPFDPVFPHLVDEAGRNGQKLIGFVAYGLYHEAKREWISDFHAREGRFPSDEELRAYERTWTTSRLEALRNAAAQSIAAYTDAVVTQAERQVLRSALKGSFWRAVWRWAVGAVLYTLIIVGLAFGLAKSGVDIVGMLRAALPPQTM